MDCFEVTGGTSLRGRVRVTGAKNSALKLMAAALLASGRTTIEEVPDILDVAIMSEVLRRLGCGVEFERYTDGRGGGGGRVVVDVPENPSSETDYDLVRRMRASISVLGPLVARAARPRSRCARRRRDRLARAGHARAGLERLGATVRSEHGFLIATAPRVVGTSIWLDFPVGRGHREPGDGRRPRRGHHGGRQRRPRARDRRHLHDAQRDGRPDLRAGSSTITVEGVAQLHPVTHTTVPDRIVAGTWAIGR